MATAVGTTDHNHRHTKHKKENGHLYYEGVLGVPIRRDAWNETHQSKKKDHQHEHGEDNQSPNKPSDDQHGNHEHRHKKVKKKKKVKITKHEKRERHERKLERIHHVENETQPSGAVAPSPTTIVPVVEHPPTTMQDGATAPAADNDRPSIASTLPESAPSVETASQPINGAADHTPASESTHTDGPLPGLVEPTNPLPASEEPPQVAVSPFASALTKTTPAEVEQPPIPPSTDASALQIDAATASVAETAPANSMGEKHQRRKTIRIKKKVKKKVKVKKSHHHELVAADGSAVPAGEVSSPTTAPNEPAASDTHKVERIDDAGAPKESQCTQPAHAIDDDVNTILNGPRNRFNFVIRQWIQEEIEFEQRYAPVIEADTARWIRWLSKRKAKPLEHRNSLKVMLRTTDVPDALRGETWLVVSGAKRFMLAHRGEYQKLVAEMEGKDSPSIQQIDLDLHRTFPNHPDYCPTGPGIPKLRRVLVAYSWHNPEIGYCQSMNFIVATMLLFMSEEEAFWLSVVLFERLLPRGYYSGNLEGLSVDMDVLVTLLHERLPDVAGHFDKSNISLGLVTREWFLTLFVSVLPTQVAMRVWDVLFNEGGKVLFRIALALLILHRNELLATEDDGISLLQLLKDIPRRMFDPVRLMKTAFEGVGKLERRKIERLREKAKKKRELERKEYEKRKAQREKELKAREAQRSQQQLHQSENLATA